jgi:DNA topoisomerase IA
MNGEHTALISYPRTDAIRLADSFMAKAKKFITSQ